MHSVFFKSRSASLLLLLLGAALFTSAAFADLSGASAYQELKQDLKTTGATLDRYALPNFTSASYTRVTVDGDLLYSEEKLERYSRDELLYEMESSTVSRDWANRYQYIEDGAAQRTMNKSDVDELWYVYEGISFTRGMPATPTRSGESSFEGSTSVVAFDLSTGSVDAVVSTIPLYYGAPQRWTPVGGAPSLPGGSDIRSEDMERIFDALVGNLANLIQSETKLDGSKLYSCEIIAPQMPPLLQALVGFSSRQALRELDMSSMQIEQIRGEALRSADGLLRCGEMQITLSSNDDAKQRHVAYLNFGFSLSEIDSTVIALPEINDRTAHIMQYDDYNRNTHFTQMPILQPKDCGDYRSTLMLEDEQGWLAAGEWRLNLRLEEETIVGHFKEVLTMNLGREPLEFTFRTENRMFNNEFQIVDVVSGANGDELNIMLFGGTPGSIEFNIWNYPTWNHIMDMNRSSWVRIWDSEGGN